LFVVAFTAGVAPQRFDAFPVGAAIDGDERERTMISP